MNAADKRRLAWLFAAAFTARFLIFLLFEPWAAQTVAEHVIIDDAAQYHRLAQCIAQEWTFCGDAFRTPGYPFYIAVFYALFGEEPWLVLLSQICLDLLSMWLIVRIGELLFSARVGIIAAALYAFDPNAMFATATLLTEPLFVCSLLAGFYAYLRAVLERRFALAALAGVLFAVTTLVRPVAEYFFVFLVAFALVWTVQSFTQRLRVVALLVVAFAATMSPWLARNYALYDTVGVSSIQGENLLFWQVSYARAWETGRSPEDIEAEYRSEAKDRGYVDGGNPFDNAAIAQSIAVEYIASHPGVYTSRLITGIVHTFANLGTAGIVRTLGFEPTYLPPEAMSASESEWQLIATFFSTKSTLEIVVGMLVLLVLLSHYSAFVLGGVMLVAARRYAVVLLFGAAIVYFAVTGGPIGLARFRLPIAPFYLLIGAVFLDHLLHRVYAHRRSLFRTTSQENNDAAARQP